MINAGSVFQLVFRLVQALVQQRTLSKIRILGSDAQLWPAEVRAKVEQFGPEVNRGGQVPRELYLENGGFKISVHFEYLSSYYSRQQENCDRSRGEFSLKVL